MNEHPSNALLQALSVNALEGEQRESLLEHLAECDDCLGSFDDLWRRRFSDASEPASPDPDPQTATRLENRVFSRIHVASLAGSFLWLATDGILWVILGLLNPLLDSKPSGQGKGADR